MVERQANGYQLAQSLAISTLAKLRKVLDKYDFENLDEQQVIHGGRVATLTLDMASRGERLSLGEPTEIQRVAAESENEKLDEGRLVDRFELLIKELTEKGEI